MLHVINSTTELFNNAMHIFIPECNVGAKGTYTRLYRAKRPNALASKKIHSLKTATTEHC